MTKRELAEKLFSDGYNCCQAVAGAFADELQMDFDTLMKLASSFGGGMGRMREVCGAVSGMFMVAGVLFGYDDPKAKEEKAEHYQLIQNLAKKFKEQNGSIICRELLGETAGEISAIPAERTQSYYQKRPCKLLVGDAAEILESVCLR